MNRLLEIDLECPKYSDDVHLATYVGKYELSPSFIISITVEESKLIAQATGQAKTELIPVSQTRFATTGIDAQVDFHTDDEGNVASLTLFQGGQEVPARKTE